MSATGSMPHVVVIASGGRTGTTFFGERLATMIPGSFSVHEPDLLDGISVRSLRAIRTFGVYHMVIGRLLGRTGIRNLSQRYLAGTLADDDAVAAMRAHRAAYYRATGARLVIESYYQWYGLLPLVGQAFPGARIVCILRDPRSWVRSWMDFGGHHDGRDKVERLGFRRLDPAMLGDTYSADQWPRMSAFARNCWLWDVIARLLSEQAERDAQMTRLYRFEDLFLAPDREARVAGLLDFVTGFPEAGLRHQLDPALLERRANASRPGLFPAWPDWSPDMVATLERFCGPRMRALGYDPDRPPAG